MNISLHIERLVLDGLSLTPGDRAALQRALQTELTRLLSEGDLPPALRSGAVLPSLPAAQVQLSQHSGPTHVGRQVAQSVYARLGSVTPGSSSLEPKGGAQ